MVDLLWSVDLWVAFGLMDCPLLSIFTTTPIEYIEHTKHQQTQEVDFVAVTDPETNAVKVRINMMARVFFLRSVYICMRTYVHSFHPPHYPIIPLPTPPHTPPKPTKSTGGDCGGGETGGTEPRHLGLFCLARLPGRPGNTTLSFVL